MTPSMHNKLASKSHESPGAMRKTLNKDPLAVCKCFIYSGVGRCIHGSMAKKRHPDRREAPGLRRLAIAGTREEIGRASCREKVELAVESRSVISRRISH